MTMLDLKEYEDVEHLQDVFRDPKAVERLCKLGVRTALVATWDGLLIDSVVCADEPVELESLAANAAAALQLSHSGGGLNRGRVNGVLAEFDSGGTIIIDPIGDNTLVAFVTRTLSDVSRLRTELKALAGRRPGAPETPTLEAPTARTRNTGIGNPSAPLGAGRESGIDNAGERVDSPLPPPDSRKSPAAKPAPVPAQGYPRRVILKGATLDVSGVAATATVELALNGHRVQGKAVARSDGEQLLYVAAEAAARAVTALLPAGYGVMLESIKPVSSEVDKGLKAVGVKVIFLSPNGEQTLVGIARIADSEPLAAAKTVLSAVNSQLETLLEDQPIH